MFALIENGKVKELFPADPNLGHVLDIRNVSAITGIAAGWIVNADGTYAAPVVPGPSVEQLLNFANHHLALVLAAGISGDVGTPGSPIIVSADTSADGKANILGLLAAYTNGLKRTTDTTAWYQSTGTVQLTQSQLLLIAQAVLAHIDAGYEAWNGVVIGINATPPTVTTWAEVDAAFAALSH